MNSPQTPRHWNHCDVYRVILLGDSGTLGQIDMLERQASDHGAVIAESHAFAPGEARSTDGLSGVPAVMDAVRRSIEIRADLWVPFPVEDLTREQHIRHIDLVLEQHGLDLLLGPHLTPCPEEGFNPVDYALRQEVRAVRDLDRAVLAAAGMRTLAEEIEIALARAAAGPTEIYTDAPETPKRLVDLEALYGPLPLVPAPSAPWDQRRAALKELAARLTESGMTQAKAAGIIHELGHRPPGGRAFTQTTVSMLLNGRYDRGSHR
jgi:hypothetical protein